MLFDDDEKGSKDYEEKMSIWKRSCHRVKMCAKDERLEESKWMKMYLRRKDQEQKKKQQKEQKEGKEGKEGEAE